MYPSHGTCNGLLAGFLLVDADCTLIYLSFELSSFYSSSSRTAQTPSLIWDLMVRWEYWPPWWGPNFKSILCLGIQSRLFLAFVSYPWNRWKWHTCRGWSMCIPRSPINKTMVHGYSNKSDVPQRRCVALFFCLRGRRNVPNMLKRRCWLGAGKGRRNQEILVVVWEWPKRWVLGCVLLSSLANDNAPPRWTQFLLRQNPRIGQKS